jgi:stalled ribosome rescue protein Dom34
MNVNAGLWIDHRRALVVITSDGGEKELEIQSHVESQPGRNSKAPYEAQRVKGDDSRERAYQSQFNSYYAEVIQAIRDAEAIFIFGPGEAKEDLRKHMERARLGDKVTGMEPADEMTAPQIAAKVRKHFHPVHNP